LSQARRPREERIAARQGAKARRRPSSSVRDITTEVQARRAPAPGVPSIMQIDLSLDDARFLHQLLARHLQEMENELVHTDKREMQREIAADTRRLRELLGRLPAGA
jgi:hypothetical protein